MKRLKSIFVILDKPKHAQRALERARVIQEASIGGGQQTLCRRCLFWGGVHSQYCIPGVDRIALGDIDLVVKSVHAPNHSALDWRLIRQCRKPLLLVSTRPGYATGNVLAALALRHADRRHRAMNRRVLDAAQRFADMAGGRMHCISAVEYPSRETNPARRHSSYPLRSTRGRDFLTVVSQDFDMSDIREKQRLMHEDTAHNEIRKRC